MNCTLGIDTSCYTTSVALAGDGRVVASERKLLTVAEGERGLRQSDGVFQHTTRLHALLEALMSGVQGVRVAAVCASTRPRDVNDSYMPVFLVGESMGRGIAAALGVPFYATSHQQGHVRAAMVDSGIRPGAFVAMHLSGGTTETLYADENRALSKVGGSNDLHAGQLVDRVGVRLGLGFPAGPALERLAVRGTATGAYALSHRDGECSFSGAEAQAMRMIEAGAAPENVAAEVYSFLARSIAWLLADAVKRTGAKQALLAGGVASSALLRQLLPARLKRLGCTARVCWARPELSGDNACGVALIGEERRRVKTREGE